MGPTPTSCFINHREDIWWQKHELEFYLCTFAPTMVFSSLRIRWLVVWRFLSRIDLHEDCLSCSCHLNIFLLDVAVGSIYLLFRDNILIKFILDSCYSSSCGGTMENCKRIHVWDSSNNLWNQSCVLSLLSWKNRFTLHVFLVFTNRKFW